MALGVKEESRLRLVRELDLYDAESDPSFDALTTMAASLCKKSMSLVSLVDRDRQFFPSRHEVDLRETPREVSFCAHAIEAGSDSDIFEVTDTHLDERFRDNDLVTGSPHLRYYAGVPLRPIDHRAVGTLCVLDSSAGELSGAQREDLLRLAGIAEQLLRLRLVALSETALRARVEEGERYLAAADVRRAQAVRTIAHDLAAPLAAIRITTESLLEQLGPTPVRAQVNNLVDFATHAEALIGDLRLVNDPDADNPSMTFAEHDLWLIVERSARQLLGDPSYAGVRFDLDEVVAIVDEHAIARVVTNLLRNALVHNAVGTQVVVRLRGTDTGVLMEVEDDGKGIPREERERMFEPYASLNPESSGLGLAITKALVEAHQGTVQIEGNDPCGTIVSVRFPADFTQVAAQ